MDSNKLEFTDIYNTLRKIDLNSRAQEKNGLTYIPWAIAVDEVSKLYDVQFNFHMFTQEDGSEVPYLNTPVGLFVETDVTIGGHYREMMLPVMDNRNQGMKITEQADPSGKKTIKAASSMDVNKALMRCLTKNIAIFGLMIGLWGKEDIPDAVVKQQEYATKCIARINELTRKAKEAGDESITSKIAELCKTILPSDCNGDPRLCDDESVLKDLELKLRAIRISKKKRGDEN